MPPLYSFYFISVLLLLTLTAACTEDGPSGSNNTSVVSQPEESSTPANVLLIMVDDLGFNDLAINNNNTNIDTPRLDQFAREGMRFTRHYATSVCSPARIALLTGQNPARHGFVPDSRGISPDVVTLPERLKEAGYNTWHLGKWHIGDLERSAWPDHQGFDHWFGFLNQWRLAGKTENGKIQLKKPRYKNPWLQGDTEPGRHYKGHLEDILTNKALRVMTDLDSARKPWLLNIWSFAPHTPISPSKAYAAKYPKSDAGRFRALVNQLDANIGRILDHLATLDSADNTIVVIVSDNGGTNRFMDNNHPFAGRKTSVTEGGLRTPLLIRWPEQHLNGTVASDIVTIQDIFPTLLDALDLPPQPSLDGNSFYGAIKNNEPLPMQPRFWEQITGASVLSGDGRWRLNIPAIIYGSIQFPTRLYDLESDLTGGQPLDSAPPDILAEMTILYRDWHREVRTIPTNYRDNRDGTATLTGSDFQRAPGFGGYTFGLAIQADSFGDLVRQHNVWSVEREGSEILVRLGDVTLSGSIESGANCHSIIFSGHFYRKVASFAGIERMDLNLYIDGKLAHSIESPGVVNVPDITEATILGDPTTATANAPTKPIVLNTSVEFSTVFTPAGMAAELCNKT